VNYSDESLRSANDVSTTLPFIYSEAIFVPVVLVTRVLPKDFELNGTGDLKSYHSFLESGSIVFFLPPFFPPLFNLGFLPYAIYF